MDTHNNKIHPILLDVLQYLMRHLAIDYSGLDGNAFFLQTLCHFGKIMLCIYLSLLILFKLRVRGEFIDPMGTALRVAKLLGDLRNPKQLP